MVVLLWFFGFWCFRFDTLHFLITLSAFLQVVGTFISQSVLAGHEEARAHVDLPELLTGPDGGAEFAGVVFVQAHGAAWRIAHPAVHPHPAVLLVAVRHEDWTATVGA
jgi:hypothetical protein